MFITLGKYDQFSDWNPWHLTLCRGYSSFRVAKPDHLQEKKFGPFMLWRVKNMCADLNRIIRDINLELKKLTNIRSNNFI
jgi:hypothetical protein